MRRMTQSTITDRIFGTCQDRQAIAVVGNVRRMTGLLRLWGKRTLCHDRWYYHALLAWCSARLTATEPISRQSHWRHAAAWSRLAFVEAVASGRC